MRSPRKQGFTLIELLIVTVVVAALMGIMFRLTGIVGNASQRETTVHRLQCLENCLSGYYATFGSYPPVPLQGASRNIYRKTDSGSPWIQSDDPNDTDDSLATFTEYDGVEAACRSQPVAAMFPPPKELPVLRNGQRTNADSHQLYEAYQQAVRTAFESDAFVDQTTKGKVAKWVNRSLEDISNPGFLNQYQKVTSANELQLFRFGLMSFLLPRYRFMLDCAKGSQSGSTEAFNNAIDNFRQWTEFNPLPSRMDSGIPYESWKAFCDTMGGEDDWQIDLIPSQAACARWIPNLKNIVNGRRMTFFGITVSDSSLNGIPEVKSADSFKLYFPGGYNGGSSSRGYPLHSMTVKDGWRNDFYYYSPAPYQTYVLWSAGPDRKTFPPWIDMEQFRKDHGDQYKYAVQWMADDIKFMSTGK